MPYLKGTIHWVPKSECMCAALNPYRDKDSSWRVPACPFSGFSHSLLSPTTSQTTVLMFYPSQIRFACSGFCCWCSLICFYGFVVVCYALQVSFLFNIMKIFKHTVKWKNLLDWPFDHSKMSFSVSGNNFCLKVCCLILVWTLQLF